MSGEKLENIEEKLLLFKLWANVYGLIVKNSWSRPKELDDELQRILLEAQSKSVSKIHFRLFNQFSEFEKEVLIKNGFRYVDTRVEFKTELEKFSFDIDSKLEFKNLNEIEWSKENLISFLSEVVKGDPSFDPDENIEDFIEDWFEDKELTVGNNCIYVGVCDDVPMSLAVTQVNLKTGWSRIAYMGILPGFRKQNHGENLHKFAIMKLKEMGGVVYHGGTSMENKPMLSLFKKNGCLYFRTIEEWEKKLK